MDSKSKEKLRIRSHRRFPWKFSRKLLNGNESVKCKWSNELFSETEFSQLNIITGTKWLLMVGCSAPSKYSINITEWNVTYKSYSDIYKAIAQGKWEMYIHQNIMLSRRLPIIIIMMTTNYTFSVSMPFDIDHVDTI